MGQARPPGESGQTWETFVRNHADDIWACDFPQLYDAWFRPIFAFFIAKHGSREVVHLNVTRSPSAEWAAQQLREATSWGEGPRFLIRDCDGKYGSKLDAVAKGAGIDVVSIPPRSPDLTPICERFLGSVRRECLEHILILVTGRAQRVRLYSQASPLPSPSVSVWSALATSRQLSLTLGMPSPSSSGAATVSSRTKLCRCRRRGGCRPC